MLQKIKKGKKKKLVTLKGFIQNINGELPTESTSSSEEELSEVEND